MIQGGTLRVDDENIDFETLKYSTGQPHKCCFSSDHHMATDLSVKQNQPATLLHQRTFTPSAFYTKLNTLYNTQLSHQTTFTPYHFDCGHLVHKRPLHLYLPSCAKQVLHRTLHHTPVYVQNRQQLPPPPPPFITVLTVNMPRISFAGKVLTRRSLTMLTEENRHWKRKRQTESLRAMEEKERENLEKETERQLLRGTLTQHAAHRHKAMGKESKLRQEHLTWCAKDYWGQRHTHVVAGTDVTSTGAADLMPHNVAIGLFDKALLLQNIQSFSQGVRHLLTTSTWQAMAHS